MMSLNLNDNQQNFSIETRGKIFSYAEEYCAIDVENSNLYDRFNIILKKILVKY